VRQRANLDPTFRRSGRTSAFPRTVGVRVKSVERRRLLDGRFEGILQGSLLPVLGLELAFSLKPVILWAAGALLTLSDFVGPDPDPLLTIMHGSPPVGGWLQPRPL
jgi:hypothetical protein